MPCFRRQCRTPLTGRAVQRRANETSTYDAALGRGTEPTVAGALAAYDAARRPRVVKVLAAADDNRGRKKAGAVKRSLQAMVMRAFIPLGYEKATAWLYAYPPGPTP